MAKLKFTRNELYRRVWDTPVTKLASEFDISGVGLAKACRKAGIPLPPVGYWAKVAHGKAASRPPLPAAPDGAPEVVLNPGPYRSSTPVTRSRAAVLRPVAVPAVAPQVLPPVTRATKAQLEKARPRPLSSPFATTSGTSVFDCKIGPASIDRTVRLLAVIESQLPAFGAKLVPGKKAVEVEAEGQRIELRLVELSNRTEVTVKAKYHRGSVNKDYAYTLHGLLSIEVTSYVPGRKRWADGKRAPLEDKMADLLQGLVDSAKAKRLQAEQHAADRKRWAEEARIREREEAHRRSLNEFKGRLVSEAQASEQSGVVRSYLARVEAELKATPGDLSEAALKWLATARQLAAQMDPLPRRVERLMRGVEPESYEGYFGKVL